MNICEGVVVHALVEIDSVEYFDAVVILLQEFPAFDQDTALGVCHDIGAVQLHQVGFQPEPCFTGTGATDDQNILVPGILWIWNPALHGQAFCFCQNDIVPGIRIHEGNNVRMLSPARGTELFILPELFSVFTLNLHKQPQCNAENSANQQIKRMKTWKRRLQSSS